MRRARALGRPRGDAGVTLVELLVTMLIMAVIGPLIVGLLTSLQKQTSSTVKTANAAGDARLAMETLDFAIRSGAVSQTTGIGAYVVNSDTSSAPATSKIGFWTGYGPNGAVLDDDGGRCVQFAVDTAARTLSTRSFAAGSAFANRNKAWTVVVRTVAPGSYFTAAPVSGTTSATNPASQVVVHLRTASAAGVVSGRTSAIDSLLTFRNTTAVADSSTSAPACAPS